MKLHSVFYRLLSKQPSPLIKTKDERDGMARRLKKDDLKVLSSLAEHRVLTASQVAAIFLKSKQVIRRRMRKLEEAKLVLADVRGFGRSRGRPEKVFSMSEHGVDLLRKEGLLPPTAPIDKVTAEKLCCVDHQLLVNWFRIHLVNVERVLPRLKVEFLSPDSPFQEQNSDGLPLVFDRVVLQSAPGKATGFTPDGVFSITDKDRPMTLLFFLEVDLGTETIASPKREPSDVRQKILNYQEYFRSGRYKRYEEIFSCSLNGFRLLFLANTTGRLAALCRLVQEIPPSDFIWLTDQERMFARGVSADIWARGGRSQAPLQSILGTRLACQAPILPLKP